MLHFWEPQIVVYLKHPNKGASVTTLLVPLTLDFNSKKVQNKKDLKKYENYIPKNICTSCTELTMFLNIISLQF